MRADKYFAETFGSRTKAAEAIEKGLVLVNGASIKPKDEIRDTDEITFVQAEEYFVSNGGYKLSQGLKTFAYDCRDKIFADIGASTGGFTDCLLQNGARKVYAIDVGESLLHESIAHNPKIVRMENTNARYLEKEDFTEPLDGVVADVSFISLRLIFPAIARILSDEGVVFVLVKPQFECENKYIGKSGIVHPSAHPQIVEKVLSFAVENGLYPFNIVNAPVRKGKNVEYVLALKRTSFHAKSIKETVEWVKSFVRRNSSDKRTTPNA